MAAYFYFIWWLRKKPFCGEQPKRLLLISGEIAFRELDVGSFLQPCLSRSTGDFPRDSLKLTGVLTVGIVQWTHWRHHLKACHLCGLDPSRYKGHSFRIGAASYAEDRGLSDAQIRMLGRWKSNAFLRYIRVPSLYFQARQVSLHGRLPRFLANSINFVLFSRIHQANSNFSTSFLIFISPYWGHYI